MNKDAVRVEGVRGVVRGGLSPDGMVHNQSAPCGADSRQGEVMFGDGLGAGRQEAVQLRFSPVRRHQEDSALNTQFFDLSDGERSTPQEGSSCDGDLNPDLSPQDNAKAHEAGGAVEVPLHDDDCR